MEKEAAAQQAGHWPAMLFLEQRQHVAAVRKAREALNEARAAPVKAAHKLEGYPRA